nr:zinc finger BED domain-containing protein RICESLEEPER 2-like [Tanacetum cinerariifolium]GEZ08117.1 zinc finger BED domain-containing protein RICESLEEPER 2-like [Tanacetum cinerariifolium]
MASGANNSLELGATGSSDPHNSNNQSPTGDLGDEQQFAKRKRACKSKVWVDMIKIDNGTRAQCIHCKGCYVISATGTTTTLQRHVSNCTEKKKADRQQQLLNFQRVFDEDKGTSSSFPGKYDPTATRELISHWKSKNQNIEYMVITGHFVDANRKLQRRVLSFVDIPPPRRGIEIADSILKCLREWEIEEKIMTISVDNASANDAAMKILVAHYKDLETYFAMLNFVMDLYDANEILQKTLELKKILKEMHAEYARLLRV